MESSLEVVKLFPNRSSNYTARKVRKWAEFYIQNQTLPGHSQGKHIKTKSLINDEDHRFQMSSLLEESSE